MAQRALRRHESRLGVAVRQHDLERTRGGQTLKPLVGATHPQKQ
jgi:hypothetical protein